MTQPEVIGLSKESIAALTQPLERIPIPGLSAFFAQGVVVEPLSSKGKKVRLHPFCSVLHTSTRGCFVMSESIFNQKGSGHL